MSNILQRYEGNGSSAINAPRWPNKASASTASCIAVNLGGFLLGISNYTIFKLNVPLRALNIALKLQKGEYCAALCNLPALAALCLPPSIGIVGSIGFDVMIEYLNYRDMNPPLDFKAGLKKIMSLLSKPDGSSSAFKVDLSPIDNRESALQALGLKGEVTPLSKQTVKDKLIERRSDLARRQKAAAPPIKAQLERLILHMESAYTFLTGESPPPRAESL